MKYYHRVRGRLFVSTEENVFHIPYLFFLVAYIVFPLFSEEYQIPSAFNDILRISIVAYSLFLPQRFHYLLWISAALVITSITLQFGLYVPHTHLLFPYRQLSMLVYLLILTIVFFREILFADINLKMVYQAIACYIHIGLIFALSYRLIHLSYPDAFNFPIDEGFNHIYLSYIVLTTIGLGDLLPYTSAAKAAVMLEAVVGQIYIAFFVSMMVGKYMSSISFTKR